MPTCKDCLHIDVCEIRTCYMCDGAGFACDDCEIHSNYGKIPSIKNCKYFKDRNRFVELPCKVGDTIYILTNDSPTGIEESQVKKIELIKTQNKMKVRLTAPCVYDDWGGAKWEVGVNDFGKKAFLNRKEAERVLKERENNVNH